MACIDMATLAVLSLAVLLVTLAGAYRFLENLHDDVTRYRTQTIQSGGMRGNAYPERGFLFRWLYLRKSQGGQTPTNERVICSPFSKRFLKRLRLPDVEREVAPYFLRQIALLSVAVMGLIRFALGEPILRLF